MVEKDLVSFLGYLTDELEPDLSDFKRDDPISFCLKKRLYLLSYIRYFPSKVQKSEEISRSLLKEAECTASREGLTFAAPIFFAPENSLALAAAYVKRSEWLLNKNKLEKASVDAIRALKCYMNVIYLPTDLCDKIRIMIHTGKSDEAEKLLTYASSNVSIYPAEELCYIQGEILKLLKLYNKGDAENDTNYECNLPELKNGENLNFPSSSNSLKVEYSKEKGRHVVAKCSINKGDVLFVEKPFAFVPHKMNAQSLLCENCCLTAETGIGCSYCVDAWYCCEKCKENDWESFHKYECGHRDFLNHTGIGRLALRIILRAAPNIDELKTVIDLLKKRETNSNTVFSKFNYENVYNLLTHAEDVDMKALLIYSLTALLLSLYLVHFTEYSSRTEENVEFCARLFLRHLLQIVTNASQITSPEEEFLGLVAAHAFTGSGIYPSVSMMNHSCEPSIVYTYERTWIIVRARKPIRAGEEVFNSYGVHHLKMKRSLRQQVLKAQYCFHCKCPPCCRTLDLYDVFNSEKCAKCHGPVLAKTEENGNTESGNKVCILCLTTYTSSDRTQGILIAELYEQGKYLLYREEDRWEALKLLLKVWKLSRDNVFVFHEVLLSTANMIVDCLFGHNLQILKKLMACCVIHVVQRYGEYSLEAAAARLKFFYLYSSYFPLLSFPSLSYEEMENTIKCRETCQLLYGHNHPIVRRLTKNRWI